MNYQAIANYGRPTPVRRSPLVLPSCGSCPNPTSYDKDLSAIWPGGKPPAVRDYLRANCWGIPIPGLPWIPGVTSNKTPITQSRFLSYVFDCYPTWAQDQWINENLLRGYTHAVMSWPDSRASAGKSLAQFAASCARIKESGLYVHVKLWSKDFDPRDMDFATWKVYADPIFAGLNGIADEFSCWEYDSGNRSDQTAIDVHQYLGEMAHSQAASFWCHFFSNRGYWWEGHEEAEWYEVLKGHVDGLDLQIDPAYDIGENQARTVDHLRDVAPSGCKVRAFEPGTPTLMFDNDHPDEGEADAFGLLTLCTKGAAPVWGGGAGHRQITGWPV